MDESIKNLELYLNLVTNYITSNNNESLSLKPSIDKWSKKEILGHLIDSGINNLQRFTEIQFKEKPYSIRTYNQAELVLANQYQEAEVLEILGFWLSINRRILSIMKNQNKETLRYEIKIDNEYNNLEFLMNDYVVHLKHHVNQIID